MIRTRYGYAETDGKNIVLANTEQPGAKFRFDLYGPAFSEAYLGSTEGRTGTAQDGSLTIYINRETLAVHDAITGEIVKTDEGDWQALHLAYLNTKIARIDAMLDDIAAQYAKGGAK